MIGSSERIPVIYRGRKMVFIKMPDTLWNREYSDKARLLQFRRAVKEGNKPSRWYYDNPADKG